MLRSLFAGISGLRVHQTMLDVTGNNIANVNTTGYKSSAARFEDTLSQMVRAPGGTNQAGQGGTNPAQVGLGVRLSEITSNFTGGATQTTGRNLDMMINGDGFFVVKNGGRDYYTRNGSFSLDAIGQLVTADGSFVQGWSADANGKVDANGPIGALRLPVSTTMKSKPTNKVTLEGNLPSDAPLNTATAPAITPGSTFMKKTQVYDDAGNPHLLELTFTKTGATPSATPPAAAVTWTVTGTIDADKAAAATPPTTPPVAIPSTTLSFDGTGKIVAPAAGAMPVLTIPGAAATVAPVTRTIDFSGLTGYGQLNNFEISNQDGNGAGTLSSFQLGSDGSITGSFSNGLTRTVGRIAMASFANPAGLEKAGASRFVTTINSGEAQIGGPAEGGRGSMTGGAVEMSNVDLSQEFTNLIISQRGFQANSRVITSSDEVLQELVNLKR